MAEMNGTLRYIDAHLHLQEKALLPNAAGVLKRAQAAHVAQLFCNATQPDDWHSVLHLARQYACVRPFVGVHPWYVEHVKDGWANELESLVKANRCGVGEIGLDFAKPIARQLQMDVFEKQLAAAARLGRPVSIHCVKAWAALTETLTNISALPPFMVHAFNGSAEIARELIRLGGYVSFNALSLTVNRLAKTNQLLRSLPADRILFETESPFGLNKAVDFLGIKSDQVNEPASLPQIVSYAARLAQKEVEVFAEMLYENSKRFISPLEEAII